METREVPRGNAAIAEVSAEVDKLSELVSSMQTDVCDGTEVAEKEIVYVTEMLMRLLLRLDGIEVEGEGRVYRKAEVCRIQNLVDTMDALKTKNSNLSASEIPELHNNVSAQSYPPLEPSICSEGSLVQRVNSLLASFSQSRSTSPIVSSETTQDSAFASALEDFKALLAKDFEEVISKGNAHRMETVLQVLCSEPCKLPPLMINPIRDIHYSFPNLVQRWNKSHELLAMHQKSKEQLEETHKILEEYTIESSAWEEEIKALSNEEKNLEARLSAIKNRKEKLANIQKSTGEKINELISLPDVRSASLPEIQKAIDMELETIAYTCSTWEKYRHNIG